MPPAGRGPNPMDSSVSLDSLDSFLFRQSPSSYSSGRSYRCWCSCRAFRWDWRAFRWGCPVSDYSARVHPVESDRAAPVPALSVGPGQAAPALLVQVRAGREPARVRLHREPARAKHRT